MKSIRDQVRREATNLFWGWAHSRTVIQVRTMIMDTVQEQVDGLVYDQVRHDV